MQQLFLFKGPCIIHLSLAKLSASSPSLEFSIFFGKNSSSNEVVHQGPLAEGFDQNLTQKLGSSRWTKRVNPPGNEHIPPLGKGKSSARVSWYRDMLVPKRVNQFFSRILFNSSYTFFECCPQLVQPSHVRVLYVCCASVVTGNSSSGRTEKRIQWKWYHW